MNRIIIWGVNGYMEDDVIAEADYANDNIRFYLGNAGRCFKEENYWDEDDVIIELLFINVDFHEWLHIYLLNNINNEHNENFVRAVTLEMCKCLGISEYLIEKYESQLLLGLPIWTKSGIPRGLII